MTLNTAKKQQRCFRLLEASLPSDSPVGGITECISRPPWMHLRQKLQACVILLLDITYVHYLAEGSLATFMPY